MQKKLVIIDGHALAYRSYYGMQRGFIPQINGENAGMVYGFTRSILLLLERFKPEQIIVCFDHREKTIRHKILPEYKGQRPAAPDDFYPQFSHINNFLEAIKIQTLCEAGYEADDIICHLAKHETFKEFQKIITSSDQDLYQLLNKNIQILPLHGNLTLNNLFTTQDLEKKWNIKPNQVADYKALAGDPSDNYKGIPGIGPKKAQRLLNKYKNIEDIIKSSEIDKEVQKIQNMKENAILGKELATLIQNVPNIPNTFKELEWKKNLDNAEKWSKEIQFHNIGRQIKKIKNFFSSSEERPQQSLFG